MTLPSLSLISVVEVVLQHQLAVRPRTSSRSTAMPTVSFPPWAPSQDLGLEVLPMPGTGDAVAVEATRIVEFTMKFIIWPVLVMMNSSEVLGDESSSKKRRIFLSPASS